MHEVQGKIIGFIEDQGEIRMTLRDIGLKVGVPHPQKIKHHLNQLEKKGFIKIDKKSKTICFIGKNVDCGSKFFNIPIMGIANCGPANALAIDLVEGYLKVSKRILGDNGLNKQLFSVKAIGNSMNCASINGSNINDGDYVLIDTSDRILVDGKYVLSLIDGYANLKRVYLDKEKHRVVLLSESSQDYSPIYIHEEDLDNYIIVGSIKCVLKKPKMNC